jgi:hypothetical protein
MLEELSAIRRGVEALQTAQAVRQGSESPGPGAAGSVPSPAIVRALELLSANPVEGRRALDRIRLESPDAKERMLAGYFRVQVADMIGEANASLAIIDATLPFADQQQDHTVRSVLRAQKAWLLNQRFVDLDMYGYFYGRAGSLIGVPLIPAELRGDIVGELDRLREETVALFEQAHRIAQEQRDYPALSTVLQLQASAITEGLIVDRAVPELHGQVEREAERVRALYETSIRIESDLRDIPGLAAAYHIYSNDLRMLGFTAEARDFAQRALELEEASGLAEESTKTRELLRRLSGGLSENAIQLIVAASMGERNFANRFQVHYRPDFVRMGRVQLMDADALRTLEEVRHAGLGEPESDDGVHGGLWRLTARGIDAAEFYRRQGYGP